MKIELSMIIPVYNVEKYIEKCIQSVINQTYSGGIECIIVDDCSPDAGMEIVERILNGYNGPIRFMIKHRQKNGGLSAARNEGIHMAHGFYLYFLDSDDWLVPECIEWLMDVAHKYPQAEIVQAGAVVTKSGYEYLSMMNNKRVSEYTDDEKIIKKYMLRSIYPSTVWNKLIKREWLVQYNLFFKEGLLHEDDYWNFFATKYVKSYAICKMDTYVYNIRQGSITQLPNEKNIESRLIAINDFMEHMDEVCIGAQRDLIFRLAYSNYVNSIDNHYRDMFRNKLRILYLHCGFTGKIIIWLILHLPYSVHRMNVVKRGVERGLSKLM